MTFNPSAKGTYIVGIGASAGGLESMIKLLAKLSYNGKVAYVIAQHMAKDGHIGLVLKMLDRSTSLPVVELKSNDVLLPDHVYVIPPACIGVLQNGRIQLLPTSADYISSPSVNALFNSIAQDLGKKAIGIILSGSGSDGLSGCRSIKAHGGKTIAQSPESAAFTGMPLSVIHANVADEILAPEDIAHRLTAMFPSSADSAKTLTVTKNNVHPVANIPSKRSLVDSLLLLSLVKKINDVTGIDFSSYKEETLLRRIERRMTTLKMDSFEQYVDYITKTSTELDILQHLFLVSLSSFFRDSRAFAVMSKFLAELIAQKKPGDAIRVWVPGCASGEECYTIAILLAELLGHNYPKYKIEIIGYDLNPDALLIAEAGSYRQTAFKEVETRVLEQYFDHKGHDYQVKPFIRNVCQFYKQNVISAKPPLDIDMVSCRNLLIYMKSNLQDDLFKKFHHALLPQGLLFIGQSENIGVLGNAMFTAIDHFHRLYRRKS